MWRRPPGNRPSPFHDLIALEVTPANSEALTRLPDAENLHNLFGTVHGGALFTAGEVAAGTCMNRLMGEDMTRIFATTRKATIEYLKPARGAITGHAEAGLSKADVLARIETERYVIVPVAVTLSDETGVAVCRLAVDWYVSKPRG
jgi:acyl-coenzyme A thioesterase PaaI-like protein